MVSMLINAKKCTLQHKTCRFCKPGRVSVPSLEEAGAALGTPWSMLPAEGAAAAGEASTQPRRVGRHTASNVGMGMRLQGEHGRVAGGERGA